MGTRMTVVRRLPVALSSALLEWILMLLLFIDAVYSYLITRFARLCKLPAPCPFCSRLDHVLGNEEPCFYRELICKTHKSEISSLAFCRLHQKLAGAETMCDGCSRSSLAPKEKPNNNDSKDLFDGTRGDDNVLHSPLTRICSCCAQHFKQRDVSLFSQESRELKPANSPKICTDYSVPWQVDEPLETKDIYHQSDHTTHERYSPLQMTSDSEAEVPCADDGRDSPPRGAFDMEKDLQEDAVGEMPVLPPHEVVKPSEMNDEKEQKVSVSGNVSSAYPVLDDMHPGSVISGSQSEATDISSRGWATQRDPPIAIEELYLEDATVPQIPVASTAELPEVLGETESRQMASDSSINPYISQFTILEQHYVVSEDKKIKEEANDQGTCEPVAKDYHFVASEDTHLKDNSADIRVSQVSADPDTPAEIEDNNPKKAEPIGETEINELISQDPSGPAFKDFAEEAHIPPVAIRSSGEVSQGLDAIEEHSQTSEIVGERRPSLSTQISMTEAYNLAIGMKSSFPSPTWTDVILGKGTSSSVNGELRLLLSQLSASRGLEATWLDPGPSPRSYGRGDDLIVQNITKRISIERNVSGLESLDGSVVSEMEGESPIDRLRRQIDLDRKSIHLLCRELEEERNAAAIAASQALAMITRLQDEKAAMQMEASHYQRMMEEQAEYDNEALAQANELLAQREQQVEELEAELENYRTQFGGGGPTERQDNQLPFEGQNTTTTLLEDERAYISECLRKLEKKLHVYSNNSTTDLSNSDAIEDDLSNKMPISEDDSLHRQENSRETHEPILLATEGQSSTMNGVVDVSIFQEEISNLHKRLKILEGDRDFLEHSVNSLKNGKEGAQFIREIACNLRELRAIAIDDK
ncbi:myosin-binding protein 1-like isoform X2 [Lolium rigidum]|uniref:myosin-binding protein 1-like isoform X2 n=1 Tax=Lolium rigidum TaxID=89674 RepID=UPI001F5C2B50|nr:myosin-binding protein 1-like isoform X2 [Lolium rigidum]